MAPPLRRGGPPSEAKAVEGAAGKLPCEALAKLRARFAEENMASEVWLGLNFNERALMREALIHYTTSKHAEPDEVEALLRKLNRAKPQSCVTLRVDGGFVEEIEGNPFPVRLYDYDIDGVDEPDFDEDGRACVISEFEPK